MIEARRLAPSHALTRCSVKDEVMTRTLPLVCLLLLATACGDSRSTPVAPSGLPNGSTGVPSALVGLSGTVYEYTPTGRRPLPNVPLDISVEYQAWPPQLTSDAEGRYGIFKGPMSALKVRAEAPGYSQPCRAGAILNGDTTLDVHLVSDTILATIRGAALDASCRAANLRTRFRAHTGRDSTD